MLTAAKIILARPNSVEEIPAIWPEKGNDVGHHFRTRETKIDIPRIFSHPTSHPTYAVAMKSVNR
jgi:hypothetical protein